MTYLTFLTLAPFKVDLEYILIVHTFQLSLIVHKQYKKQDLHSQSNTVWTQKVHKTEEDIKPIENEGALDKSPNQMMKLAGSDLKTRGYHLNI